MYADGTQQCVRCVSDKSKARVRTVNAKQVRFRACEVRNCVNVRTIKRKAYLYIFTWQKTMKKDNATFADI